ncbi:helix-turn-helix domain-containing protein [Horticoccus luteus]|uniref:Helix-turn-helix domain-containing protein n=1 Tax=Horticoccus luteus TaxID=2862869 RepID=A0A8F9TV43_9BACT|nr:helix-turn-helix domain-containing protein [Horticoccus luteus]QYM78334.1 helix-turn-helix domain-containing protein [Horticoccus luteus]
MAITTTGAAAETEVIETGEQRDALGRRRRPAEQRAELLAAYRSSGLTQRAFARREGINYTTFCSWAQCERAAGRLAPARPGRPQAGVVTAVRPPERISFVEAALPAMAGGSAELRVRLPDGTEVRGGDVAELAKLVRALRG